jgi:unsaturated rhamnogalacturonyl hydrolase
MKKTIIFWLLTTLVLHKQTVAQDPAERMAATVMKIWKDSLYMDASRPAKWTYDQGVILKGIEGLWYQTGDGKYFDYMQKCMDFFVNDKGEIRTYKAADYNLDNILCGRILLTLYNVTSKEKYYKAALTLREQLKTQPRTKQGGFWHKKIYPWQMWLDGLYMAEPFYAEWAKQFHEAEAFDDIANQFIWMEKNARDAKTGLLYHGWDESREQAWANKETGTSPHFWARAMAWYAMALSDALEHFPEQHPKRDSLIKILQRLAAAVQKTQDPVSGCWYDIINLPKEKGNYLESSASSMFVCALAKGVRLGYLTPLYMPMIKKGYEGIQKQFLAADASGMTVLNGTVTVSGLGGNPYRDGSYAYYMSEKVITNDPKGVGAFLQCAVEMNRHRYLSVGKGKSVLLDDYFNSEKKKDITGAELPYHYKWYEQYNNGFSLLGDVCNRYGLKTKTLSAAPTAANLKGSDIYIIVDADNTADNPAPNYMTPEYAAVIADWVKAGGVLVLFHNDKGNAEFEHFNLLPEKFGIHYNEDSKNRVPGNSYEYGKVDIPTGNAILPHVKKIYQKEVSPITVQTPASAALTKDDFIIFAVSKLGKGTVFATGDPWLYNEYTDGRKLPLEYENLKAAQDLVQWLIRQVPEKPKK